MTIKLVIFDMDGVIVDSEPFHEIAKRKILHELGINKEMDFTWSIGRPNKEFWDRMIDAYQLRQSPEELEKLQYDHIVEQMRSLSVSAMEGLSDVLQWLKTNNILIGLASSSNRYFIDQVLNHLRLTECFNFTTAGDEVSNKKPAPDVYKKVLSEAGVLAKNAVAVEDSAAGTFSAVAAGLTCIGYWDPKTPFQDLSLTTTIISELKQVITVINEMINPQKA
ncbi:HAD family hydrolase [Paenibacillus rhizophilus]|uniref:HAD family phosphatase n=1 Tax=Paenibacillus rhizophilus TaxID=1850366 RepID=A0A3N9NWD8_9BACL|nr:HAD family phosphatase [Paenibacillus rhizophilus]RQW08273.1 HAD family phosphatase [Paenibacillus rhizophilus]